jgi:hypothetical protein
MHIAVLFTFINHNNNLSKYPFCCELSVDVLYNHLITIDIRCILINIIHLIEHNDISLNIKKQLIKKCMKNNYIIGNINDISNYSYMLGLNKNIEYINL